MKNVWTISLLFLGILTTLPALSDEIDKPENASKNSKEDMFAVSADESTASESLNRISGQYDMGFAAPEQSYKSEHQYKPGPFSKAAAEETAKSNNY